MQSFTRDPQKEMMKKTLILPPAALLPLFFLLSGCYTLLKHPQVAFEDRRIRDAEMLRGQVSFQDDCIRCHQQPHDYYNASLPYGSYYRGRGVSWLYYYDSPWWSNPRYYGTNTVEEQEGVPNPRQFGRRHYTGNSGGTSAGAGSVTPGSGARAPVAKRGSGDSGTRAKEPAKEEKRGARRSAGGDKSKESRRKKKN